MLRFTFVVLVVAFSKSCSKSVRHVFPSFHPLYTVGLTLDSKGRCIFAPYLSVSRSLGFVLVIQIIFIQCMNLVTFIDKELNFHMLNKNAKALKLHSVILLFLRLFAIIAFLQRLSVILTVIFYQMHLICTYS